MATQAPSSAPPPCSPFRMAPHPDQNPGVAVARITSLPIRPPSNSLGGPSQMTPREYGSSRPESWHPALMGSYGMRPSGYPMSEGLPRYDAPQEYESCEPYSQGMNYRADPRGWQPPYEPAEYPTVLTLRLREIVSLLPVTDQLYDPRGLEYEIVPVVQSAPNHQMVDSIGERIGPFPAERSPDNLWRVTINSPVLRFAYSPHKLYHFKIIEYDQTTRQVMGLATLSLTPDGLDIAISQNPLVPPEQIINNPQFKRSFTIVGRDAIHRGELVMSMLFDYQRPNECLWPSDQYIACKNDQAADLRPASDTRSTSAEIGGTTETQRSAEFYPPRRPHWRRQQAQRGGPYLPIHDDYDDDFDGQQSMSWWDIIGPELQNNLKAIFCLDTKPDC